MQFLIRRLGPGVNSRKTLACVLTPPPVGGTRQAVTCFSAPSAAAPTTAPPTQRYYHHQQQQQQQQRQQLQRQSRNLTSSGRYQAPRAVPKNVLRRRSSTASEATAATAAEQQGGSPASGGGGVPPFPSVSRVDPAAAEQETAIKRMSQEGEWESALEMLQCIRDEGMKPSMSTHMDVMSVCRRALEWDQASKAYREMIEAHLTDNPFDDMACQDYEDESNHVLARACGIVAGMQADAGIKPNNGTYRALLQLCKDEGSWETAILLLEHSRRSKTKLNLFSFDLLVTTVAEQGYKEVSTMLYELGVVDADRALLETEGNGDGDGEWPKWPLKVGRTGGVILELHELTQSIALETVQVALLDVIRRPLRRPYWSGDKRWRIVTGMGNNSKDGEAVIKPAVVELLEDLGLRPEFQQGNEGCVELKPASLEAYIRRMKRRGAAAASTPP
ncbi:unnamed protein product [Ectocarpus sp. 8 AP-2014]